jgi:hypothetical protein
MYQTPELLLVGAAQHLVLGSSLMNVDTETSRCLTDVRDGANYHDTALW